MMDALKENQSKGDLMMEAIKDQKEVLINLRSEVTKEMEVRRKKAENENLTALNDTQMMDSIKEKLENKIEVLEKAKATTKEDQGSLRREVRRLRQETEENAQVIENRRVRSQFSNVSKCF